MDNQSSLTASAAPSPGPTSPEGKARCSRIAEKHGMYSSAELRQHYYLQFAPASQPQSDLVDQMIASTWRLRRLDAAYQDLDLEIRAHFAFDNLSVDSSTFATYNRNLRLLQSNK